MSSMQITIIFYPYQLQSKQKIMRLGNYMNLHELDLKCLKLITEFTKFTNTRLF